MRYQRAFLIVSLICVTPLFDTTLVEVSNANLRAHPSFVAERRRAGIEAVIGEGLTQLLPRTNLFLRASTGNLLREVKVGEDRKRFDLVEPFSLTLSRAPLPSSGSSLTDNPDVITAIHSLADS